MLKVISKSVLDTENVGLALAKALKAGDILALRGDLGAGKTALVRGLARGLGFSGEVTSPTYALVHEYIGEKPLYHFDMYRITDYDSLYSTGFFDFLDTGAIIAIEWSENIAFALPKNTLTVELKYGEKENERVITMGKMENGEWRMEN